MTYMVIIRLLYAPSYAILGRVPPSVCDYSEDWSSVGPAETTITAVVVAVVWPWAGGAGGRAEVACCDSLFCDPRWLPYMRAEPMVGNIQRGGAIGLERRGGENESLIVFVARKRLVALM